MEETVTTAVPAPTVIQVAVPLQDARQALQMQVVKEGKGQAIEISAVRPGSGAEQAGVRVGHRVRALMDPVRSGEFMRLNDRPSLRFVLDVINMTLRSEVVMELDTSYMVAVADPTINLQPEPTTDPTTPSSTTTATIAEQLEARYTALVSDGSIKPQQITVIPLVRPPATPAALKSTDAAAEDGTIRVPLPSPDGGQGGRAAADPSKMTDVQKRIQKRKEYLSVVSERNDAPFFAMLAAAFLLPAAVILGIAFSTGYLDQLYSNTLSSLN